LPCTCEGLSLIPSTTKRKTQKSLGVGLHYKRSFLGRNGGTCQYSYTWEAKAEGHKFEARVGYILRP
jgi:hypothetical protein